MELPEKIHSELIQLANGMQAILCDRPHLHRISIMLNVTSGCRDEKLNGTAHMLEHLVFRGTSEHPSLRALSEAFEKRGADFNAFTAREVTSFELITPPESLAEVLQLLGSAILRPKLTGIAAERDIVREEILADYDTDGHLINEEDLLVNEFYGHAGCPIAGNPEDIDKISKAEVLAYYDQNYRAERMTLVAVGPIADKSAFITMIENAFDGIKRADQPRQMREMKACYRDALQALDSGKPLPAPRLVYALNEGATQSEIAMGYLCNGVHSREFYALSMLVRLLDDGMASRLSRRLVEEMAIVYDAEASLSVTSESTLLQIHASCRHRRVPKLITAIYALLEEIANTPIPADEFERIQHRVVWEHRALLDGGSSLCSWISAMHQQELTIEPTEFCHDLLTVTPDEVTDIAKKLLAARPHLVAIVGELGEKTLDAIKQYVEKNA